MAYQKLKIAPVIYQRKVCFTIYARNWLGFWTKPLIYHSTIEDAEKQMLQLLTPHKHFGRVI